MSLDTIQHLPIRSLVPSPHNRRTISDSDPALQSLASSIQALDVLEPLLVRPLSGDRWEIIAGHRRHRACFLADRVFAPCIVHQVDDGQAKAMTLVENLQREGLHWLDEALSVADLIDELHDPAEVAARVGHDVRWVIIRASLRHLIAAWVDAIRSAPDDDARQPFAWIGVGHAALIARLPADTQASLLERISGVPNRRFDLEELQELIEGSFVHLLAKAPWALDDLALYPASKACSDCPKRSSCQTMLWPDQTPADDRCTDPTCWNEKNRRYVISEAKRLAAKGGKVAVIVPRWEKTDLGKLPENVVKVEGDYALQPAKKSTPGAVQAVDFETGKTSWRIPASYAPQELRKALDFKANPPASGKGSANVPQEPKGPSADDRRTAKRLTFRLSKVAEAATEALGVTAPERLLQIYAVVALEGGNLRKSEAWKRIDNITPEIARELLWSDLVERLHNFGAQPVFATQLDAVDASAVARMEQLLELEPAHQASLALAEIQEPRGKAANLSGEG